MLLCQRDRCISLHLVTMPQHPRSGACKSLGTACHVSTFNLLPIGRHIDAQHDVSICEGSLQYACCLCRRPAAVVVAAASNYLLCPVVAACPAAVLPKGPTVRCVPKQAFAVIAAAVLRQWQFFTQCPSAVLGKWKVRSGVVSWRWPTAVCGLEATNGLLYQMHCCLCSWLRGCCCGFCCQASSNAGNAKL